MTENAIVTKKGLYPATDEAEAIARMHVIAAAQPSFRADPDSFVQFLNDLAEKNDGWMGILQATGAMLPKLLEIKEQAATRQRLINEVRAKEARDYAEKERVRNILEGELAEAKAAPGYNLPTGVTPVESRFPGLGPDFSKKSGIYMTEAPRPPSKAEPKGFLGGYSNIGSTLKPYTKEQKAAIEEVENRRNIALGIAPKAKKETGLTAKDVFDANWQLFKAKADYIQNRQPGITAEQAADEFDRLMLGKGASQPTGNGGKPKLLPSEQKPFIEARNEKVRKAGRLAKIPIPLEEGAVGTGDDTDRPISEERRLGVARTLAALESPKPIPIDIVRKVISRYPTQYARLMQQKGMTLEKAVREILAKYEGRLGRIY